MAKQYLDTEGAKHIVDTVKEIISNIDIKTDDIDLSNYVTVTQLNDSLKGLQGKDGVSVSHVTLQNYCLIVTFSNGEIVNLGSVRGEQGEKGADGTMSFSDLTDEQKASLKGDKGDKGEKGDKGDAFTYTDFTSAQLAALKGDKGEDGKDGTVSFDDLTDTQKASLKGDKGDKGDRGENGDGMYIGKDAPTDPDVHVWIDTDGIPYDGNVNDLKETFYTKEEVNALIPDTVDVDLSDYYTKKEVDKLIPEDGINGVSPTIAEHPGNSDTVYQLDITDANGSFTTPNLKGGSGSGDGNVDLSNYYNKAQVEGIFKDKKLQIMLKGSSFTLDFSRSNKYVISSSYALSSSVKISVGGMSFPGTDFPSGMSNVMMSYEVELTNDDNKNISAKFTAKYGVSLNTYTKTSQVTYGTGVLTFTGDTSALVYAIYDEEDEIDLSSKADKIHTHTTSDITGISNYALKTYVDNAVSNVGGGGSNSWTLQDTKTFSSSSRASLNIGKYLIEFDEVRLVFCGKTSNSSYPSYFYPNYKGTSSDANFSLFVTTSDNYHIIDYTKINEELCMVNSNYLEKNPGIYKANGYSFFVEVAGWNSNTAVAFGSTAGSLTTGNVKIYTR